MVHLATLDIARPGLKFPDCESEVFSRSNGLMYSNNGERGKVGRKGLLTQAKRSARSSIEQEKEKLYQPNKKWVDHEMTFRPQVKFYE